MSKARPQLHVADKCIWDMHMSAQTLREEFELELLRLYDEYGKDEAQAAKGRAIEYLTEWVKIKFKGARPELSEYIIQMLEGVE